MDEATEEIIQILCDLISDLHVTIERYMIAIGNWKEQYGQD